MLPKILTSIFGSRNERLLKQYRRVVERINGIAIGSLADVVRALAAPQGGFQVVETDYHGPRSESARSDFHSAYGTRIVLDGAAAPNARRWQR